MFKYFLSVLCLLLLVQDEPTMQWSDSYRLNWSDFQAEPKKRADVIAVTASGLSFGYSTTRYGDGRIEYDVDINAHFYPERSWYLENEVTSVTLAHERLHFDITELHARKFRKRVREARFSRNIDAEIDKIYKTIQEELRAMQNTYDKETSHSRVVEQQIRWEDFISKELLRYRAYH